MSMMHERDRSPEKVMTVLVLQRVPYGVGRLTMILDFLGILDYSEELAVAWGCVLVVTNRRCIFAQQTSQMFTEERLMRTQKAKEEHKGFVGRWEATYPMNVYDYIQKYLRMEPEIILHENNENYFLENSDIDVVEFVTTIEYSSYLGHKYSYRADKFRVKLMIDSKAERYSYIVYSNCLDRNASQPQAPYHPKEFGGLQEIFGQKIRLSTRMIEDSGPDTSMG